MHKLKYAQGQEVEVVKDTYKDSCSHGMALGAKFVIAETMLESREGLMARNYQEYYLEGGGWVTEQEIKAV